MWDGEDETLKLLTDNVKELGNWHSVKEVWRYLTVPEKAIPALVEIHDVVEKDKFEFGYPVRLRLGSMKVFAESLVPLFQAYRDNASIKEHALRLMVKLTLRPVGLTNQESLRHLEHLQDCKEAFAKRDMFLVLMTIMGETMDAEAEKEDAPDGENAGGDKMIFGMVLNLFRNLISVPDPRPGDAGYTPLRHGLTVTYISHLHDEGVMDFFLLFLESVVSENSVDKSVVLLDILYHICAQVDPEKLTASPEARKSRSKNTLGDLLEQEQALARLRAPQTSRHSRFGTRMTVQTAAGGSSMSTKVQGDAGVARNGRGFYPKYTDPTGTEKKRNMFHDPFFVDLEEGAVREHNLLNPFMASALGAPNDFSDSVLSGLCEFYQEFVQTSFSQFVSMLRCLIMVNSSQSAQNAAQATLRPKILNFVAWVLEFHRQHHLAQATRARKAKQEAPVIDIAMVQGAIDLEMLQFVAARLREYEKNDVGIHSSFIVLVLRTLSQQVKTLSVVMDAKESETRDCGDALMQNLIKDNVMYELGWIMKNYKPTSHDPRILSYTVEVFHHVIRNLGKMAERAGHATEYATERPCGNRIVRGTTSAEKEIANLADCRVIDNLFVLLEKYQRHSTQFISFLVKLIYSIVRAKPTNIVVFFELSYFMRINRIMSDPVVRDKKAGRRYEDMVSLLQYILRQFFKCAEKNHFVFVELLFRKVAEKEVLSDEHSSEFAAILNNYNDNSYRVILEKVQAGEKLKAVKKGQKATADGHAPWTADEDEILRTRYPAYIDHPLCAELLSAELPAEMRRSGRQVRKRLVELGLMSGGGDHDGEKGGKKASTAGAPEGAEKRKAGEELDLSKEDGPAAKKAKLDSEDVPFFAPAHASSTDVDLGGADTGDLSLEDELENFLRLAEQEVGGTDSMGDSFGELFRGADALPDPAAVAATALDASCAPTTMDFQTTVPEALTATAQATAMDTTAAAPATALDVAATARDMSAMDSARAATVPCTAATTASEMTAAAMDATATALDMGTTAATVPCTAPATAFDMTATGAPLLPATARTAGLPATAGTPLAAATMPACSQGGESSAGVDVELELEAMMDEYLADPGATPSQASQMPPPRHPSAPGGVSASTETQASQEGSQALGPAFWAGHDTLGSNSFEGQPFSQQPDGADSLDLGAELKAPWSPAQLQAAPRAAATPQRRRGACDDEAPTPAATPFSAQVAATPWSAQHDAQVADTPDTPLSAKVRKEAADAEAEEFWKGLA